MGQTGRCTGDDPTSLLNAGDKSTAGTSSGFHCIKCDKVLKTKGLLAKHAMIHAIAQSFTCNTCAEDFPDGNTLRKHANEVHKDSRPFKCTHCRKGYGSRYTLVSHMLVHTGLKPHRCHECGKSFADRSNFKRHILLHTGIKPFVCNVCDKGFTQNVHLKSHMRKHSMASALACPHCNKIFTGPSILNRHILTTHSEDGPFICPYCNKPFVLNDHLQMHLLTHIQTTVEIDEDDTCMSPHFFVEAELKTFTECHENVDEQNSDTLFTQSLTPFEFSPCFKGSEMEVDKTIDRDLHDDVAKNFHVFPEVTAENTMENTTITNNNFNSGEQLPRKAVKRHQCSDCDKSFLKISDFKKHIWQHRDKTQYACKRCGRCFQYRGSLLSHLRAHSGEKSFSCSECNKSFIEKSNLKRHVLIHSGIKPFRCNECGKSFNQNSHLSAHMHIHLGLKPFPCPLCNKSFAEKSNLKRHVAWHSGTRAFVCDECGQSFSQKSNLLAHHNAKHEPTWS